METSCVIITYFLVSKLHGTYLLSLHIFNKIKGGTVGVARESKWETQNKGRFLNWFLKAFHRYCFGTTWANILTYWNLFYFGSPMKCYRVIFLKNLTKSSSYRILNRMTHGLYLIRSVIVVSNNSEKFTWEIKLFKKRT